MTTSSKSTIRKINGLSIFGIIFLNRKMNWLSIYRMWLLLHCFRWLENVFTVNFWHVIPTSLLHFIGRFIDRASLACDYFTILFYWKDPLTVHSCHVITSSSLSFIGKIHWLWIPVHEWMTVYLFTTHITSCLMVVYKSIERDRTSACESTSGCCYQSIFDLTHPPNLCMKCEMTLEIDHNTGNYVPYSF